MKRLIRSLVVITLCVGAGYFAMQQGWLAFVGLPAASPSTATGSTGASGGSGGRAARGDGPIPVLVAQSVQKDVPETIEAVGTITALKTVTVHTQVDGKMIKVLFQEGQDVQKDDVLALIDPATNQAQYDQAVAKKAQDSATLANAQLDLVRYEALEKGDYGSRQQADTQRSLVAQLTAQVQLDQAAIDNAKVLLDYCTIKAPISGRMGIRLVDEGNIVHAADTTGIVIITQVKPISVVFNLPQQSLQMLIRAMARGTVPADVIASDNSQVLDHGQVDVIDNTVDQTTGTIKVKASFPNEQGYLWPGQFVNVRLTVRVLKDVVTVPSAAVQRGPTGSFVYVVGDDNRVAMTPVTIGLQDETQAVVRTGLTVNQRVVTTGFSRLTDGKEVNVTTPPTAEKPPADNSQRQPRRQQRNGSSAGASKSAPGEDANSAALPQAITPAAAAPAAPQTNPTQQKPAAAP